MLVTRLGIGNKDIDNSRYENMKAIYSNDVFKEKILLGIQKVLLVISLFSYR
jgi:hypothetical protein